SPRDPIGVEAHRASPLDARAQHAPGIEAEGEVALGRRRAIVEGRVPVGPREDLDELLVHLIADVPEELDGLYQAEGGERVAEAAIEARQHRESHVELPAADHPARDE